jgi:hypothetical protein
MAGGVGGPGRTRASRNLHDAQIFALRLWLGLGNIFVKPRQNSTDDRSARGLARRPAMAAFAGAVLGCLTTLYLCAFGIAPGIASALATSLICGQVLIMRASHLLPSDFFIAVYGGSFVGMTPVLWLHEGGADHHLMLATALFISLSVVSGLLFGLIAEIDARWDRRFASGFGGRSGAIATLSSFLFVAAAPLFGAEDRLFHSLPGEALELDLTSAALILTACAVGLFATLTMLRWRSTITANQAERTFVASAIALIGMACLYLSNPGDIRLLDAFYAGCFLGMSAPERLGGWSAPFLGALVLAIMLVLVRAFLPGIGGSLGLAAFVTVMILAAFRQRPEAHVRSAAGRGFSTRGKPRRRSGTIVYPVSGLFALGCFVLLLLSARQQPALDRATTAEANMPAMPSPLALGVSHEANDTPSLEAPAAGSVDLAISLELPQGDKTRALSEGAGQPPPEASSAVVSALQQAAGAAVLSDALPRAGALGLAPVTAAPPRDREVADDAADADERLFHEFMQWRAAHGGAVQARPQPARTRSRPAQLVGLVAPTPSPVPARPVRPKPVSSIDPAGWPASLRPKDSSKDASRDPRAVHNVTAHPAPSGTQ